MASVEASPGRKKMRRGDEEGIEWKEHESDLCWGKVLVLLNELVLSICILTLTVLVLGVRKPLTLVQSLNRRNIDRESPRREYCMRTREILKLNQDRVKHWNKNRIESSKNQKHEGIRTHEYEKPVKPQNEAIARGLVFLWRDIVPRKRRREKKPQVRLKAEEYEQDGMNDRDKKRLSKDLSTRRLSLIPTKSTRLTSESSTASANSPRDPPL